MQAMLQRYREKEQKRFKGAGNKLLKSCVIESFQNHDQKSLGKLSSRAEWYLFSSRRFLACHVHFWQLHLFAIPGHKELILRPLTSLPEDVWS